MSDDCFHVRDCGLCQQDQEELSRLRAENERLKAELQKSMDSEILALRNNEVIRKEIAVAEDALGKIARGAPGLIVEDCPEIAEAALTKLKEIRGAR